MSTGVECDPLMTPHATDILGKVRKVAVVVFGCAEEQIRPETTAAEIDGWDSLSHTEFLVELEREFSIRFELSRIVRLANVADLVTEIQRIVA